MDFELEKNYQEVLNFLEKELGEKPDMTAIIFLVGLQELGMGYRKFSKQEKVEIMHVAICYLLSPYGYYEFIGRDADNWPHFESKKKLPSLDGRQQQTLLKQAIVDYFIESKP
ncbi:MAG: hypothetical protein K1X56_14495 [Flavobacteriales bacterium]|nr:hypothetical protein [Flavobacteriales bacterium]